MDHQVIIDRISEVSNLTDSLEDDAADWLIDWGITQAGQLVAKLPPEADEAAGQTLTAVMGLMRQLNHLVAGRQKQASKDLTADLSAFAAAYRRVFGVTAPLPAAEPARSEAMAALANDLPRQPELEALQTIINRANGRAA